MTAEPETVIFRSSGISYVHIPAVDRRQAAEFYRAVFGWTITGTADDPSFADGTGHVVGRWVSNLAVVGEAGVVPYIYIDDLDAALVAIADNGGAVVRAPYPEGDLWVATFRDPAGNVLGAWQRGPR